MLKGKTVLLGITGGIAAYKSAALTSMLVKAGADVRVIMTEHAKKFISVELSMGQMIEDVKLATECMAPVELCNRVGGMIPSPEQVLEKIVKSSKEIGGAK